MRTPGDDACDTVTARAATARALAAAISERRLANAARYAA